MNPAAFASAIFGTWDETSDDGAFVVDRASSLVTCANPRFAELLGRDAGDLAGCPLDSLLPPETRGAELLTSFGPRDHVAFRHAAGGVVYLTLIIAPVSRPGHAPLVACLCRDTTGTRRLGHERRLARHSQEHRAQSDPAQLEQLATELGQARRQLEERDRKIAGLAGQVSHLFEPLASAGGGGSGGSASVTLPPREYPRDHAPARPQDPSEDHS